MFGFLERRNPEELEQAKLRAQENLQEMKNEKGGSAPKETAEQAKERLKEPIIKAIEDLKAADDDEQKHKIADNLLVWLRADWEQDPRIVQQAFYDLQKTYGMPAIELRDSVEATFFMEAQKTIKEEKENKLAA